MSTTTPTDAAALRAALVVREAYLDGRARGYLDLGGSRARRALTRLEEDARRQAREEGYARLDDVELTRADLRRAFVAEARRRLGRTADRPRDASIRNALRRAANEFGFTIQALGLDPELERIRDRSRRGRMVTA